MLSIPKEAIFIGTDFAHLKRPEQQSCPLILSAEDIRAVEELFEKIRAQAGTTLRLKTRMFENP
jgi:hypothetical protein